VTGSGERDLPYEADPADVLDQDTAVDPADDETGGLSVSDRATLEADPADVEDQSIEVPLDDDPR